MNGGATRHLSLLTHVAVGCLGIFIGALVVYVHRERSPSGEPPPSIQVDTAGLERDIRRAVREELALHVGLMAASPIPPQSEPAASAPEVVSPEVAAQSARADAVLVAAAARRVWTDEDAREFRSAIAELPPAERQGVMLKFAQAVNEGGMRLETSAAPF